MLLPFTTKCCLAGVAALMMCAVEAGTDTATLVENKARQFLQEQAAHEGLLEPRVTLQVLGTQRPPRTCRETPEISAADTRQASRMRFVALCVTDNWREEYVVRADMSALVVVAASRIDAGAPIVEEDLKLERSSLVNLQEVTSDPAFVAGKASRRALRAGQVLERKMLVAAVLVRKGATVQIVARNAGIVASSVGEATGTGRRDEVIAVRNATSGKLIRARVSGVNEVEPLNDTIPQSP
jgi:flagella basal body P-ring formation protein FlgA